MALDKSLFHIEVESNGFILPTFSNGISFVNSTVNNSLDPTMDTRTFIEKNMGPKRQSLTIVVPITVVYTLIFVTGLIGNISTCIVIARNKYMHTATNFYLFSLAISDLLMLILGLPPEMYQLWSQYPYIFGEFFCIFRGLASETSTNASILTITAFTVERYIAICNPIRSHTMSKLSRAIKFIIGIWFVATMCAVPVVVQLGIDYLKFNSSDEIILETSRCGVKRPIPYSFEISSLLFFILPMTVITILYLLIGIKLRRSTLSRASSDSSNNGNEVRARQQAGARQAVLKMLVAVVVAFFICWAPFHAQRVWENHLVLDQTDHILVHAYLTLYYVTGIFYYVSSTINPILYNIMSLKFRKAFRNTICSCFRLARRRNNFHSLSAFNGSFRSRNVDESTVVTGLERDCSPDLSMNKKKLSIQETNIHRYNNMKNKALQCRQNSKGSSISGSSLKMLDDDPFDGIEMSDYLAHLEKNNSMPHNGIPGFYESCNSSYD